jgi:hypothetical protein
MTEFCQRCHRDSETILLPLSSGHVGRVCAGCRMARRGRPYASKREYEAQRTPIAERPEGEPRDNATT